MTEEHRTLQLDIEVPGTPDEVWRAVATGPGISSWYVPHTIEERAGGAATARFGAGPEMEVTGRVADWEPPSRVFFVGDDGDDGLTFEWLIEASGENTCTVRLINRGFAAGDEGEIMYGAMSEGWKMFLGNLQLHLEHFAGQSATASLPTRYATGSAADWWGVLTDPLDMASAPVGARVELDGGDGLLLTGTVVDATPTRWSLLVDGPAAGTAFLASEQVGDDVSISVWSYLYGEEGADAVARDEPRWQTWLDGLTLN